MNTTIKDKRAVILEFHSSPDAILNALHQAGWQIIPKKRKPGSNDAIWEEQPQRSEPKHPPCDHVYSRAINQPYPRHCIKCDEIERQPETVENYIGDAALDAAQPQRSKQEWTPQTVISLLQGSQRNTPYSDVADAHNAALAAEREKKDGEHDNEVRKPLVDALEEILSTSGDPNAKTGEFDTAAGRARRLLDTLAKQEKLT